MDGKAYPVVQIVPVQGFYDYENKYKPGAVKETCPAPISEELTKRLQEAAVDGYHALEMESYALFHNAKILGKRAACLLTISDSFVTHRELSAKERQTSFDAMMKIALETAKVCGEAI